MHYTPEVRSAPSWAVVVVTAAAMVVGTSMTFTVAVLAPFMIEDGVVGLTSLGAIPAAYYFAASAASRPAGMLADVVGGRRAIVLMCSINGAALLVLALAPALWVMILAALAGGAAMSVSNPSTNLVVMSTFVVGRRGAALGWKQAGVPLSGVLAGVLLPSLAGWVGWRWSVVASVLIPLIVAVAAILVLPGAQFAREGEHPELRVSVGSLGPFAFLMGVATGALNTYLVVFSVDAGMSPASAGLVASTFAASAAVSRIGWAVVVERLGHPRVVLLLLAALSATTVVALPHIPAGWQLGAVALVCGAAVLGWQAAAQLTVLSSVPPRAAGTASAGLLRSFFAGLLAGPLFFAAVLDVADSYDRAFLALGSVAAAAGIVVAVRAPVVTFVGRRREPAPSHSPGVLK